jgi:hypothetical protein
MVRDREIGGSDVSTPWSGSGDIEGLTQSGVGSPSLCYWEEHLPRFGRHGRSRPEKISSQRASGSRFFSERSCLCICCDLSRLWALSHLLFSSKRLQSNRDGVLENHALKHVFQQHGQCDSGSLSPAHIQCLGPRISRITGICISFFGFTLLMFVISISWFRHASIDFTNWGDHRSSSNFTPCSYVHFNWELTRAFWPWSRCVIFESGPRRERSRGAPFPVNSGPFQMKNNVSIH